MITQDASRRFPAQTFISQITIEVLDETVLLGLPHCDGISIDVSILNLFEDRCADDLSAVDRDTIWHDSEISGSWDTTHPNPSRTFAAGLVKLNWLTELPIVRFSCRVRATP